MPILAQDIKLRASRVMADVPEGGGGPAAQEIGFGESNTVFDDVDSISRTLGNVSIRQLHMHVDTPDTDRLLGAYAVVAKLPADPNVSVTLAACDPFARRGQIATAIANYLIRGVPWNGFLLGNHVQGQGSIQLFQRPGTRLPTIGRTLALVVNEDLPTEWVEWVRVIRVDSEEQTCYNPADNTDYKALVVTCEIASPLSRALPGTDPNRQFAIGTGKTKVRDTTTADAANYYGAAALTQPAGIGALTLKTASAYGQLVPSSATPVPSLDQRPAAQRVLTLADAPRLVQVPATPHARRIKIGQENRTLSYVGQMRPLPAPGTVVITWVGLGNRYTIEDDGAGNLSGQGVGQVDYLTGSWSVTLPSLPDIGSAVLTQWGERVAYTDRAAQGARVDLPLIPMTLANGGYRAGTLALSWTSGGIVKRATADTGGVISGDASGAIDRASGTVYLQPASMIDAGGQILVEYDTLETVIDIINAVTPDAGGFATITLSQQPAEGTLSVRWMTAQTVTVSSGGSVGFRSAQTDLAKQTLTTLKGQPGGPLINYTPNTGELSGVASVGIEQQMVGEQRLITTYVVTDDGAGALGFDQVSGTVNYATRQVNLRLVSQGRQSVSYKSDYESAYLFTMATSGGGNSSNGAGDTQKGGEWGSTDVTQEVMDSPEVFASYTVGAPQPVRRSETITPEAVRISLTSYTTDRIVPGSVRFTWMGAVYEDLDGVLYRLDGASRYSSGSVDYLAGIATLTDYLVGPNPQTITLQSLWTSRGDWRTASLFMMTAAAPVVPTQFTLLLLDAAGNALTATGDLNGNLIGDHVTGVIDYQSGLVEIQFGDFVPDASLTDAQKAEWWYDPADVGAVEAGKIWRPWPVDPASLRYNIVSNLYLPVDPDILGLNPTRLPQDGKVPIYKKGRILIIGHNGQLAPATYGSGQSIDCGRTRLSHVWLIGADGKLITGGYSAGETELDAGLIHVTDPSGWAQPVTVEHRIQDMALCTDVQIDGTLGINIPLTHNYPAGSVVSSAVLFGNTWARVAGMFDQGTWDGVTWDDVVHGNAAVGKYNDTAYPILVSNDGALSDRYALRLRSNLAEFDFISEGMGTLGAGSLNADFAPANPIKPGVPLLRLSAAGWGGSWVAGNTVFIKVQAAMQSMAVIRTVQPGAPAGIDYSFDLLTGGDVDRPALGDPG